MVPESLLFVLCVVIDTDDQLAVSRVDELPNIGDGRNARDGDGTELVQRVTEQVNTAFGAADDLETIRNSGNHVDSSHVRQNLVDVLMHFVVGDVNSQAVIFIGVADVLFGFLGRATQPDAAENDQIAGVRFGCEEVDGDGHGISCRVIHFGESMAQIMKAEILLGQCLGCKRNIRLGVNGDEQ